MTLPSSLGAATTEQVGYFHVPAAVFADWLVRGFDSGWQVRPAGMSSLEEVVEYLSPGTDLTRYECVPVGDWTVC